MTQREAAAELRTTRANISMIESRARKKVALARETIEAYHGTLTEHSVRISKGTRFYDIPPLVLKEGDKRGIHLRSNLVDIVRMVRGLQPSCLEDGRTTRSVTFFFNPAGKVRVGVPRRQDIRRSSNG